MSTKGDNRIVQPYLSLERRCEEETLEFYRKTLGAEVTPLVAFRRQPQSIQAARAGQK